MLYANTNTKLKIPYVEICTLLLTNKLTNLKSDCLQPHVLILRADLTASHDGVPRRLHPPSHLLQPGSCNPPGGVLGVGRDHRLEKETSLLHITIHDQWVMEAE